MYEPANICEVLCYTVRWTITKVVRIGTDLISDLIKKKSNANFWIKVNLPSFDVVFLIFYFTFF